jgi:hypothetical protein
MSRGPDKPPSGGMSTVEVDPDLEGLEEWAHRRGLVTPAAPPSPSRPLATGGDTSSGARCGGTSSGGTRDGRTSGDGMSGCSGGMNVRHGASIALIGGVSGGTSGGMSGGRVPVARGTVAEAIAEMIADQMYEVATAAQSASHEFAAEAIGDEDDDVLPDEDFEADAAVEAVREADEADKHDMVRSVWDLMDPVPPWHVERGQRRAAATAAAAGSSNSSSGRSCLMAVPFEKAKKQKL